MRRLSDIVYNQSPLVMRASDTVREACHQMGLRRVGSVLVIDSKGHLTGIFTGRDAVLRVIGANKAPDETKLSEVMTKKPVTLGPQQSAIDALRLMWDGGFRHLPVVKDGKIAGVVSRGDFKGQEHATFDEERDLWEHMR